MEEGRGREEEDEDEDEEEEEEKEEKEEEEEEEEEEEHTLVAHHQVRQTLKENKSTVSRGQGSGGQGHRHSHLSEGRFLEVGGSERKEGVRGVRGRRDGGEKHGLNPLVAMLHQPNLLRRNDAVRFFNRPAHPPHS